MCLVVPFNHVSLAHKGAQYTKNLPQCDREVTLHIFTEIDVCVAPESANRAV